MFSFDNQFVDERYFSSDSLQKGRTTKKIFKELSEEMLEMAVMHGRQHRDMCKYIDYPFWYSEEKIGWMLPAYFYKRGYLVWSEWTEKNTSKRNQKNSSRKIDFMFEKKWGQACVELFIEVKKIYSSLDGEALNDTRSLTVRSKKSENGLLNQLYNMKEITPNYCDHKILMGLLIVDSGISPRRYEHYKKIFDSTRMEKRSKELMDEVAALLDRRRNLHLIGRHASVNWDDGDTDEFDYIPKMISIVGIFCDPG